MKIGYCLASVVLLAVATGGCGQLPGQPAQPPGTVMADPGRFGAPKVENPRTFDGRDRVPCASLLTADQLADLEVRVESAVPEVLPSGNPSCTWGEVSEGRLVDLTAYASRDFLVDTYRNRSSPTFAPTTIAGLPAVVQQSGPTSINCDVTTGIAEGQALDVTVTLFQGGDLARRSCEEAVAVSAAVVSNLPPTS